MTSRWAYEALMVNQFKNNEYEKKLYASDQKLKDIYFIKHKLIDESLSAKENMVQQKYAEGKKDSLEKVAYDLAILRKYLTWEQKQSHGLVFPSQVARAISRPSELILPRERVARGARAFNLMKALHDPIAVACLATARSPAFQNPDSLVQPSVLFQPNPSGFKVSSQPSMAS